MYIKILVPPVFVEHEDPNEPAPIDDIMMPARTLTIHDVVRCEFFTAPLTHDEFRRNWGGHEYYVPGRDPWKLTDANGRAPISCLIYTLKDGSSHCILFTDRAFLCNDQGKAVERYVASS